MIEIVEGDFQGRKIELKKHEQFGLKLAIVRNQNDLGSPLPQEVFPRLVELNGLWIAQRHWPGPVPIGLNPLDEKVFSANRSHYAHQTMHFAQSKYPATFTLSEDRRGFTTVLETMWLFRIGIGSTSGMWMARPVGSTLRLYGLSSS